MLKDELIGTEMIPVVGLRQGYRSVPLRNAKGLRLQLASVLIRFRLDTQAKDITHCSPPTDALPIAYCLLSTAYRPLLIARYSPVTARRLVSGG